MQTILEQMLEQYKTDTLEEKRNALKEIVQEVALCGLSRAGFFKNVAFYGGTALRIFYGLDRFSEDLDFSLIAPNKDFELQRYFSGLESELASLGLRFIIEEKQKAVDSDIKSAFLKGNTKQHILSIYDIRNININPDENIKIKFEIDTNPPAFATFENKYRLLPTPYQVKLYDVPSLFAGKLHAVICRAWRNRVKGLHTLLNERFNTIDFEQAKQDVLPFIADKSKLDLWNKEFFIEITKNLQSKEN